MGKFTTKVSSIEYRVSNQIQVSINIVGIRYRTSTTFEQVLLPGDTALYKCFLLLLLSGHYSVPTAWRIHVNIPYSVDFRSDFCSVNLKPLFQIYIIHARVFVTVLMVIIFITAVRVMINQLATRGPLSFSTVTDSETDNDF